MGLEVFRNVGRRLPLAAGLWLAATDIVLSQAPETGPSASRSILLGARGGPVGETPSAMTIQDRTTGLEYSARAGVASDYVYRGVSLSDRGFAFGAGFEVAYEKLYAGIMAASVKLPSMPSSEISFAAGWRPKIGIFEFDLAWTYYAYPKESVLGPTGGTDYWEASLRADTRITDNLRFAFGGAYSPNVSNTGAWGKYVAAGLGYDIPAKLLAENFGVSISGSFGYSRFGNMDELLGGFPLPAYSNWNAGVTFSYKIFNFDLRYYDTNLSRENCYIYTGDTGGVPGGIADPLRNPEGLMSRLCGAAVVGKIYFALN